MGLDDWLQRIGNLHPVKWDLGLTRVSTVARSLGVLQPAPKVFLVGGTNGKGSTCAAIASLCASRGLSVGLTTSPHLVKFNERILVDGLAAGDDEICDAFARIDQARGQVSLTYFEFAALAAMDIFKRREVDVAVLEIGLGGRLDAMNIVEPDVSVITRIALDHESWLGSDRESIGREKAGIMRSTKPCVIADPDPPDALAQCAEAVGATPLYVDRDFGADGERLFLQAGEGTLASERPAAAGLPVPSLLAALQAVAAAGMVPDQADVDSVFGVPGLAGRFQRLELPVPVVLDVAHNPDAAGWLAQRLASVKRRTCRAVLGMYRDKDYPAVIQALMPQVDAWYLCEADESRAASMDELAHSIRQSGGSVVGSYGKVSRAYDQAAADSAATDLILVFGSFPIVGGVLEHLGVPV